MGCGPVLTRLLTNSAWDSKPWLQYFRGRYEQNSWRCNGVALRTGPSVRARAKAICPHDKALCSWVCTIVLSSFEISGLIFSPLLVFNSYSLNFTPKQHLEFLECRAASSPEGSSSSSSSPQQKHYFAHKSSEKKKKKAVWKFWCKCKTPQGI